MELIYLQSDINPKPKLQDIHFVNLYLYLPIYSYPQDRFFAFKLIALFCSTYIYEHIFLYMKNNKSS